MSCRFQDNLNIIIFIINNFNNCSQDLVWSNPVSLPYWNT